MACYLLQQSIPNEEFVISRCGVEEKKLIDAGHKRRYEADSGSVTKKSIIQKLLSGLLRPNQLRERLFLGLLGDEYRVLQVGRFRLSGENHRWMYDSYSLGRLLDATGFKKFHRTWRVRKLHPQLVRLQS